MLVFGIYMKFIMLRVFLISFLSNIIITIISYRTKNVKVVDPNFLKSVTILQLKFQSQFQMYNCSARLVRVHLFLSGGNPVMLVTVRGRFSEHRALTPMQVPVLLQLRMPFERTLATMRISLSERRRAQGQLKRCNSINTIHL